MEKGIKLITFDVGGVLRDSSKAINEGFKTGFAKAGLPYKFKSKDVWHLRGVGKYNNSENAIKACLAVTRSKEDLNKILNQLDAESALDELVKENITSFDSKTIEKIRKEYKSFFNMDSTRKLIKLQTKTKQAITMLKKHYKLAIFTNASLASVKRDIAPLGLSNFSVILSEDHVKQKKPSGEGILTVCKKMKINPKNTIYVGDSAVDIKAAKAAGCISVAVTCGMGTEKVLREEVPDYLFKNIYEMAKHFCDEK